jgi:protein tyrosine/serine phosphatase
MSDVAVKHRFPKWLLIAIAVAAVAVGLLIAWNNGLKTVFKPKKWGVVEAGKLYRSGQISERLIRPTLTKNHIGLVIDMSVEDTPDARAEREAVKELNIQRVTLPLRGNGVGDPERYVTALSMIIEAERKHCPVLVHCQAGTERTGGVIAVYRILVDGMSEEKAFAEARSYGHSDRENPHLVPFIEEHLKEWKTELTKRHLVGSESIALDH